KQGRETPLIMCDPVAPGKVRGPHNCKDKACNDSATDLIRAAVASQQSIDGLDPVAGVVEARCPCWLEWMDELRC
nr:hypothetical protein [Candidatus Sigynarchaeota archaeon]